MKSFLVILCALALLPGAFAPSPAQAADQLPPDLERVRVETISRLSSLYELD
ncbi:MAG: hypothetical protein HKN20_03945, partial [Gemmatimonadetes bacterium]|nr:hypothetical protein [Gemmatimonadota bacterium]